MGVHMPASAEPAAAEHAGHTHESGFTCASCGGAFATQDALKDHSVKLHPM